MLVSADGVERLRDAFGHEPREAVRLDGDQIGHVHDVGDLRETATIPVVCLLEKVFICLIFRLGRLRK